MIGTSNDTMRIYRPGNRTLLNIDADTGRTSAIAIDIGGTTQYYIGMPTQAVPGLGARFAISYQGDPTFVINGSSGIGIGITNPTEKLHVVGDALITGDSHADAFKPAVSGNPIKFKNFDSSTEFARITDDGYLGLGVTSPNAIMQISGTSPSGRALHITDNKTSKSNGTYTLQVDSSAHTSNMSAAGAFNVEVNSGNAFTIAGNGSSTFGYNVTVGGTLYYNGNLRSVSPSKLILYNNSDKTEIHSAGTTGILFKDNSNNERARITSGGNLLINTTTDSGPNLQVNGRGYFNGNVIIENNNELRWKDSGGSERTILELTNTNDLYFGGSFAGSLIFIGGGSYTERARISDNGNLLVGGTTENAKLTVRADSGYAFRTENASGKTFRIDATNGYIEMPGNVSVGGSPGAVYKLDVVGKQRVQSVLELEDVLTLNAISTPSDPANNKSSIYMDSADGAIKVKINVGGTVVTRTIASFE